MKWGIKLVELQEMSKIVETALGVFTHSNNLRICQCVTVHHYQYSYSVLDLLSVLVSFLVRIP